MASKKELERRIETLERAIKQGAQPGASGGGSPTPSGKVWDVEIPFELDMKFDCTGKDCFFCKGERGK